MTTIAPTPVSTSLLLLRSSISRVLGLPLIADEPASTTTESSSLPDLASLALSSDKSNILIADVLPLWNKSRGHAKLQLTLSRKKTQPLQSLPLPPNTTPPNSATSIEEQKSFFTMLQNGVNLHLNDCRDLEIKRFRGKRLLFEEKYGKVLMYDARSGGLVKEKVVKPNANSASTTVTPVVGEGQQSEAVATSPPPPPVSRDDELITLYYIPGSLFGVSSNGPIQQSRTISNSIKYIHILFQDNFRDSCVKYDGKGAASLQLNIQVDYNDEEEGKEGGLEEYSSLDELPDIKDLDFILDKRVTNNVALKYMEEIIAASSAVSTTKVSENTAASTTAAAATTKGPSEGDDESSSPTTNDEDEMVVNAFEVSGKIDYAKLIETFGSSYISEELCNRLLTTIQKIGKVHTLHPFIRRGIFFSHRDLNRILDLVDKKMPFYLYTGRGPSSQAMHLGHLVPFLMTKWLQEAFDVPLVIQMTDDEKFLFKGEYTFEDGDNLQYFRDLAIENAKDIIAIGFDYKKTFIFTDCDYIQHMYPNIVRIWKSATHSVIKAMFGFTSSTNIGCIAFPAIQAAPSFPSSFPIPLKADKLSTMACLIPCAIDQDPYFRLTRDIAHKLVPKNHPLGGKPALIHSKFFPPLQGAKGKMSSSNDESAVFLTDSPEAIKSKIKTHAFSGGQETSKLQRELGADLEIDVSYQWLNFFLDDDELLERIGKEYKSGSGEYWATGVVKDKLVSCLQEIVGAHQKRREKVDDEEVKKWMTVRELEF